MADGTQEPDKDSSPKIALVCAGCGDSNHIKKPFKHEDATGIFWCGKCGTLLNRYENKVDALVPVLTGYVMKAMTGHSTAEELAIAKQKAKEEADADKAKREGSS